ncbi:MAG TPA: hypothetical protein VFB67_09040 [Candidatus Polarisedimenticolaceae bacterium]|nr:hypothetical protein [Candidatus Polarisedimenticolaceae bacterium]
MLRIQRDEDEGDHVTLILQGRLVTGWTDLLERECGELRRAGRRVVLDLSELVFIGPTGLETLARLARSGVGIVGCSPLIAAMLEQEGVAVTRTN